MLKHENVIRSVLVFAHQAVLLRWLSYRLLKCVLSCNMLEKNTVLHLFYRNQENEWPHEPVLNCRSSPILLYVGPSLRDRVRHLLDSYFFNKDGWFLNLVVLNISVALNTWIICSHSETGSEARQTTWTLKMTLDYNHSQFPSVVTSLCPRTIPRLLFLGNV